jgi:hypothetical protein
LVVNSQVTNDHTMTTINNEHNINDHWCENATLTSNTLQVGKLKMPQSTTKWKVQKGQMIKQIPFK